jgi:xanthosine utilization system XapX-like protein
LLFGLVEFDAPAPTVFAILSLVCLMLAVRAFRIRRTTTVDLGFPVEKSVDELAGDAFGENIADAANQLTTNLPEEIGS